MKRVWVAAVLALAIGLPAGAQVKKREPLNELEIDQLRETKLEPVKRLRLYLAYAQARMATIEQMRSDARFAADRGQQVHRLLEDFFLIIEELDRNIDMYADENVDARKALKDIIEAGAALQLKLRALKETSAPGATERERSNYAFVLEDTQEALNGMLQNARETMDEQNALDKDKKLYKSYEDKEEKQTQRDRPAGNPPPQTP